MRMVQNVLHDEAINKVCFIKKAINEKMKDYKISICENCYFLLWKHILKAFHLMSGCVLKYKTLNIPPLWNTEVCT